MSPYPSFFPLWVVVTRFLNIFFMLLLARSELEVLSAFPKLYWDDDTPPGRRWPRLSRKTSGYWHYLVPTRAGPGSPSGAASR